MRLLKVERGHRLGARIKLWLIGKAFGRPAPDILRALLYRPELFGKPFLACLHAALRGPSEWSVGERELMAAFVSRRNQCPF